MTTAPAPAPPTGRADEAAPAAAPHYPRTFWVLTVGFGVSRIGAVLVPFLALYLVGHVHLSATAAGGVLAVFGGGWVVGQPLAGSAADRFGRRTTVVVSMVVTAAAYLLLARTTALPGLLALAALIGLTFDGGRAAISAWIADMVPEERRTDGFGFQYWMINAGGAASGALGGYLAGSHITWLCEVDAGTCLAFAALVLTLRSDRSGPTPPPSVSSLRQVLTDRRLLAVTALSTVLLTVYQQLYFGLPLTMHHVGLPASAFGVVNVVNGLAVLALFPLLQPLIRRHHPMRCCVAAAVSIGAGTALNGLSTSTVAFSGAAVVWTVGEVLFGVAGSVYVTALATEDTKGRYLGVWGSSLGISMLLAPLCGSLALAHGTAWLWDTGAALSVLCAVGFAALATAANQPTSRNTPAGNPSSLSATPQQPA